MEVCSKTIRLFLDLQAIVNAETPKIFGPIMAEVERQGQKVLLFPPIESTTWVEWVIKKPKGDVFAFPHFIFLMIQPDEFAYELNLVVVARFGGIPGDLQREVFQEHYRVGQEFEPPSSGIYSYPGLKEMERFPLNRKINPVVIAASVVAHAQGRYKFMTRCAKERREERAKRKARALKKQALAHNTPTPTT